MNDHDHTPRSDPHDHDRAADERIDALARAAGSELRRPAPADGIARVQRATRRRQATRIGAAGVTAVAILAVGAIVIGGRDGDETLVPATVTTVETDDTVGSTVPDPTNEPSPTVTEVNDETLPSVGSTTPPSTPVEVPPNAAGDPEVVYVSQDLASMFGSEVSTVDPRTGEVRSTFVVDDAASEASRAAQNALLGTTSLVGTRRETGGDWFTTDYTVGSITYSIDALPSEVGLEGLSDEALALFDRCSMSGWTVTGSDASALPERIRSMAFSADGRWLVVVGGECPVPGTLVDGVFDGRFDLPVTLFDATRPDRPGIVLVDAVSGFDPVLQITFSPDARFVTVQSAGAFFGFTQIRVFDATSGEEIPVLGDDCSMSGTRWSRFVGPWIGDSSLALQYTCDGATGLLVRDLVSGEELDVDAAAAADTTLVSTDIDTEHYDRPANAWFTICVGSPAATRCSIGQGAGPLVELPGVAQASFLPLGFEYGG